MFTDLWVISNQRMVTCDQLQASILLQNVDMPPWLTSDQSMLYTVRCSTARDTQYSPIQCHLYYRLQHHRHGATSISDGIFFLILIKTSRFVYRKTECEIFCWYIGVNEIKCCTTLWNVFSQRRFHCVGRLEKVHSRFLLFPPFPHFENFCQDLMARVSIFLPSFPHLQWAQNLKHFQKLISYHFQFLFGTQKLGGNSASLSFWPARNFV